ncbi:helix-turn-helix transcriptional regulator [Microbacterium sp. SA39]|uniref:helix-turn-helix transcriptional regulator n=1 Tax=Microbacterium sp. SA39 TaxID=1263625 RepID=UPI00061F329E|nr:helix-turn-helix domain-containing protein [Microbacterium sp. SA39]KJQ53854.1 DNA-binding transcriptional activator FeaR [Microbacterium sp. SA39]
MTTSSADEIGTPELSAHGFHETAGRPLRGRKRALRNVVLLASGGESPAELAIDTARTHPEHAAFLFISTDGEQNTGKGPVDSVVLAPYGATTNLHHSGHWEMTCALVPRRALTSFVNPLPGGTTTYSDRRLLGRGMHRFARSIVHADAEPSSIESYAIEQLLTKMGGAILFDRFGVRESAESAHDELRDRAIALILQQCPDPAITPAHVADELQISLRLLQAAFSSAGMTVSGEIRRQRSHRAHSLLVDERYLALSIDQIAKRAGFSSTMTLRRALLEDYGTTPGRVRPKRTGR